MPHVPGHEEDQDQQGPDRRKRLRELLQEASSKARRRMSFRMQMRGAAMRPPPIPSTEIDGTPSPNEAPPVERQATAMAARGYTETLTGLPKMASGLRPPRKLPEEEETARREAFRERLEGRLEAAGTPVERRRERRKAHRSFTKELREARLAEDPVSERTLHKLGERIDKAVEDFLPEQPGYEDSFAFTTVPHALGSTGGFFTGGAAGAVLRSAVRLGAKKGSKMAAGYGVAGGMGAAVGGSGQYEDALKHGADEPTAVRSMYMGMLPGAIEAVPVMQTLGRFTAKGVPAMQSLVSRTFREASRGAIEEAIQEGLQTVGANAIAQAHYAKDREWSEGLVEAMAAGAVAGGAFSGAFGYMNSSIQSNVGEVVLPHQPDFPGYDPWGVLGIPRSAEAGDVQKRAIEMVARLGVVFEVDEKGNPELVGDVDPNTLTTFGNILTAVRVIDQQLAEQAAEEAAKEAESEPATAEATETSDVKEDVTQAPEEPETGIPVSEPLGGRGERVSRTPTERIREEVGAEDGSTVKMRQEVYEEEYEDGSKVVRNEQGEVISETPAPEPEPEPEEAPDAVQGQEETEAETQAEEVADEQEVEGAAERVGGAAAGVGVAVTAPDVAEEGDAVSPQDRQAAEERLRAADEGSRARGVIEGSDLTADDVDNLIGDALVDLDTGDLEAAQEKIDQVRRATPPDPKVPSTTPPGFFEGMGPTQAYRKFQETFEGAHSLPDIRDALVQGGVTAKSPEELLTGLRALRRRDRVAQEAKKKEEEPPAPEPTRHEGAQPRSLGGTGRNKEWGAFVPNRDVEVGDIIQVTTRRGKQWDARVTEVVRQEEDGAVVRTERTDKPKERTDAPRGESAGPDERARPVDGVTASEPEGDRPGDRRGDERPGGVPEAEGDRLPAGGQRDDQAVRGRGDEPSAGEDRGVGASGEGRAGPVNVDDRIVVEGDADEDTKDAIRTRAEEVVSEPAPEPPAKPEPPPLPTSVPERTVEERIRLFSESFWDLDEGKAIHDEVDALLLEAEKSGEAAARAVGNMLTDAADSFRERDPSITARNKMARRLTMALFNGPDRARAAVTKLTANLARRRAAIKQRDALREGPEPGNLLDDVDDFLDALGEDDALDDPDLVSGVPDDFRAKLEEEEEGQTTASTPTAGSIVGTNYRLEPAALDDLKGKITRARQNIAAIRLAQLLEKEERDATREEQDQLVRFVGWGGIAEIFARHPRGTWQSLQQELKQLLTEKEYRTASRSTQYAHYTSLEVVKAIYDILGRFGVKGTVRMMEPSAGVGHFIGMSPFRSRWLAVEMDHLTGAILKKLYPELGTFIRSGKAGIGIESFQDSDVLNEYFDVVVGNPPYRKTRLPYDGGDHALHNYFFLKSLDKVRPGGLLAFVTTKWTLDARGPASRQAMARRADFLGAIRLPMTAFEENAGTKVTTDIIFFQKRAKGQPANHRAPWMRRVVVDADVQQLPPETDAEGKIVGPPERGYHINEYYVNHPAMLLGQITQDPLIPRPDKPPYTLAAALARRETDPALAEMLEEVYPLLPSDIYEPSHARRPADAVATGKDAIRPGQWTVKETKDGPMLFVREGDRLVPATKAVKRKGAPVKVNLNDIRTPSGNVSKTKAKTHRRLLHLVRLNDAARKVIEVTDNWQGEEKLAEAQKALSDLYDSFVDAYGPVNKLERKLTRKIPTATLETGTRVRVVKDHPGVQSGEYATVEAIDKGRLTLVLAESGNVVELARKDVRIEVWANTYPNLAEYTDQTGALVRSLDRHDEETGQYVKAAIFTERLTIQPAEVTKVEHPWQGVVESMRRTGGIDMKIATQLAGVTELAVRKETEGKQIFHDPESGEYQLASDYLAGNVRRKLAIAEEAAAKNPRYETNVKALREIQPEHIGPAVIRRMGAARIGAAWFHPKLYAQFAREKLGVEISVTYRPQDGKYQAPLTGRRIFAPVTYNQWSITDHRSYNKGGGAHEILRTLLNGKAPRITETHTVHKPDGSTGKKTVKNQQKTEEGQRIAERMQTAFEEWLLRDDVERSVEMANLWNEEMNHSVPRSFDGSFLQGQFHGLAETFRGQKFEFRPHQLDAIWRGISDGNVLYQHSTGSGKTFILAGLAMMAKQMGINRKPMIVVPNAIVEQFAGEFLEIFPGANVLVADPDKFSAPNRRQFFSDVKLNDWDAVVMAMSQFEKVPTHPETEIGVLEDLVDEFRQTLALAERDKDTPRFTVKEIEAKVEQYEQEIRKLAAKKVDRDALHFEDLGVDMLMVDEAHNFKNLDLPSFKVKSLNASSRAMRLYLMTRHIEKVTPGRGIVLSTATPISNDMTELYKMMRYVDERGLRLEGYPSLDSWISNFVAYWTELDYNDVGQLVPVHGPRRYANPYALRLLWERKVDVIQNKDLAFSIPKLVDEEGNEISRPTTVIVEHPDGTADTRITDFMLHNLARWEFIQALGAKKAKQLGLSFFSVMWDGRKASLDSRLVTNPHALYDLTTETSSGRRMLDNSEPFNRAKVEAVSEKMLKFLDDTKEVRATAMIFIEFGVEPNGYQDFSMYDALRQALIDGGVPANEIAFIRDADNDPRVKQQMLDKMNNGEIRVMFGTTTNLGTGVNAQRRLGYLAEIDAPWKPSEVQQREGRILRQGNWLVDEGLLPGVRIDRFVSRGSYDAKIWNVLEKKIGYIEQLLNADPTTEMIELPSAGISGAEQFGIVKASAAANPHAQDRQIAGARVAQLESQQVEHDRRSDQQREHFSNAQYTLGRNRENLEWVKRDADSIEKHIGKEGKGDYKATIDGQEYTKGIDASQAIEKAFRKLTAGNPSGLQVATIGKYGGLDIMIRAFLDFGEWYYRVGLVGVPSHGSGYSRRERPREKIYLSNPTGSPGNLGRTLGLLGRDIAGAQVAKVEARIRRAEETIEELRPLLNKPFSGKKDLAEARKEFARLTDLFNTYTPETGSQDETERPDRQPPPPDDVPIEEVGPMVQHNPHALSVLLVEWEGLPEGTVVFVRDNREQAGHVDVVVIAQKGAGDHGQFSVITAEGPAPVGPLLDPDALREEGSEYDPEVTAINAVHRDSAIRTYGSLSKQVAVASGVASRARHMARVGAQVLRAGQHSFQPTNNLDPFVRSGVVQGTMKPLHAWVDIRGQRITSAEDAFRLLREFGRSKTQENLHYIGVDENGKVLFHQAKSSGAISYIGVDESHYDDLARMVDRSGASKVYVVHNHPSGDSTPSNADLRFHRKTAERVEAEVESVVIDSNNFSVYDATGHERVWLRDLPHDPHYSRVRTATDAAYIFHSLQRLITTYVLFLDGANQAVALVPIPPTSKPRKEWLEREARRYGAETAIVGVQGDQAVDEMADHLEGIRMTNPAGSGIYSDVGGVVRDVINIDSRQPWADRKKGRRQLKLTMPMLESTLFQTPSTEVWALMEEGAEYDPETVKPEHGDWRKMREPRKLRSRRLEGARLRLIAFTERLAQAAEDETGLTPELLSDGLRIIAETTIPARTQEIITKAKKAATISQLRNAVAEARRAYTVQLKTYAIQDLKGAVKSARLDKMHPEYLAMVRKLLRPFKLGGLVSAKGRKVLGTNGTDTIRSETLDEIRTLIRSIQQIAHEHSEKMGERAKERTKKLKATTKRIRKDIEKRVKPLKRGDELGPLARMQSGSQRVEGKRNRSAIVSDFLAPRPADMLRVLSPELYREVYDQVAITGYDEESRLLLAFRDPVERAFNVAAGKKMRTIREGRGFMRWYTEPTTVKGVAIKRGEAMQILLARMDPTNEAFMRKRGVTIGRSKRHVPLDDEVVQHLKEFVGEGAIHAVQAVFDMYNGPTAVTQNKATVERWGFEIATVVNYVPRRVDWRDADDLRDPLENVLNPAGDPALTTWGHWKARVGTDKPLHIDDILSVFYNFTAHAARLSAYLNPATNAMLVLAQHQSAIEDRFGEAGYQHLTRSIELQSVKFYERNPNARWVRKVMGKFGLGILSLRPATWFLNPAGLFISAAHLAMDGHGPKAALWLARAMGKAARMDTERSRIRALVDRYAPYWKRRYSRAFMHEITAGMTGESVSSFGPPTVGEVGMEPLQASDRYGARVRWRLAEYVVTAAGEHKPGTPEFYRAVNQQWMRLMMDGENSGNGMDLTGALAWGRRDALAGSAFMFQSAVSKIYSLAWRARQEMTQPGGSRTRAVWGAAGVLMSIGFTTMVRSILKDMLADDEDDEIASGDVARMAVLEALGTTPVLGGMIAPLVKMVSGKGAPYYQPSVLIDGLDETVRVGVQTVKVGMAIAKDEAGPDGGPTWPEMTKRLLEQSVSLGAKYKGLPYDGPKDYVEWGARALRDSDEPWDETKVDRPDTQQERWKLFRSWNERDMGLFREQVKAYTEKTGKKPTDRDLLGILNRRRDMSRLTKYEPGKPDRKKVSPMLLDQIDSELERREELRTTVRMMARANPDLVTMTPQGLPRVKRPTVRRPRVKRPGQR